MPNTRQMILIRFLLLFAITIFMTSMSSAQTVVYDWSSNSKVPESYPRITREQNVTFNINNVNDILYSYRLEVTQTPMAFDDFNHIAAIFKRFTPSGTTGALANCPGLKDELKGALQDAIRAISEDPKLPIGYAASTPHTSIPLRDSIAAWRSHAAVIKEAMDLAAEYFNNCPLNPSDTQQNQDAERKFRADVQDFKKSVQRIENAANASHVFSDHHVISPGNNVSVTVVEMLGTETVSSKTFTFSGTDVLSLSAGALFSTIPDRSYESRKTPNSTQNVLTVEGNSKATPNLVALLNYSLGALRLDSDTAGLALSAGPVLRLGGQSGTSPFGFFTGLSGHLYHRFYVTPGIHFGQFSDFPVGFGNGSPIPANFGELTPVKRWTGRFAVAITFKTKDFSAFSSSNTPAVTGSEGSGGGAQPRPTPTPTPSPEADTASNAMPNNLRRSFLRPVSERPLASADLTAEPRTETISEVKLSPVSYYAGAAETGSSVLHVTSLDSSIGSADERVSINAAGSIRDYTMYFKGGRFYLVIPHATLDVIQDGLRGRVFREPLVEKRGDDLILSFVLIPGTRASVRERPNGLDLILMPSSSD
jgi:hypothetical protein